MHKKKILYFISEFPRLTETFIQREVHTLIKRGNVEVTVLSMRQASGKVPEEVMKVTHYKSLDWRNSVLAVKYFFTRSKEVSRAFSFVMSDKRRGFVSSVYLFLKSLGYTRIIEDFKPDHLHAHFFSDPSTIILCAATILGIPYSISGHARDVTVEGSLIAEKVINSKFVAVCNKHAWNRCVEEAGEENAHKVKLMYHGVDPQTILDAEPAHIDPERSTIFTVARLVEKKGLIYLIEASKILLQQNIEHRVYIAGGPGDIYENLLKEIKARGLEGTVIIEGEGKGVEHQRVLSLYKSADVFVLPSIETNSGDADGVPNVIVEAALARVPIITTDAGGITDFIVDRETGLLVPQKDAQALAVQIAKILSDEDLAERLTSAAHAKALEMFDIDRNVGALEALLMV